MDQPTLPNPKAVLTAKRWPVQISEDVTVYMRRLPLDIGERCAEKVLDLFINSQAIGENITQAYFGNSSFQDIIGMVIGPVASTGKARQMLIDLLITPNPKGHTVLVWEDGSPVTEDDINDPDKFTLAALPILLKALWQHPDLLYFLSQGRSLWEMVIAQNPSLRQLTEKIRSTFSGTASTSDPSPSPTDDGGNDPSISSGVATG